MAHAGGRPPHFDTPEKLQKAFKRWKKELSPGGKLADDIPDVEGFCYFVGAYRQLLMEYEQKPEFSTTIKEIKTFMYYEKKQLAMKNKMNPAIFIFDAKNNFGYVERIETDHTTNGKDLPTPILGGLAKANPDDVKD